MPLPAQCPKCDNIHFDTTIIPPDKHEYEGWVTYIECEACEFNAYEPELK